MRQGYRTSRWARSLCKTAAFAAVLLSAVAAQAVEVGEAAPDFVLPGSDGETYRLSELRGQYVVVAFFPKAFTGG